MILRQTNARSLDIDMGKANGSAGPHWAAGTLVTAPSARKVNQALSPNQRKPGEKP